METVKETLIKVYNCLVPRKGKGAKGNVAIKAFGRPRFDKDDKAKAKIAKGFDYSEAETYDTEALIAKVSTICNVNEALMRGADYILRNGTTNSSAVFVLAAKIWEKGLAMDVTSSRTIAKKALEGMAFMKSMGQTVPTIEQYLDQLAINVAKLKADGLWIAAKVEETPKAKVEAQTPKLVDNRSPKEDEDSQEDSQDDSDIPPDDFEDVEVETETE